MPVPKCPDDKKPMYLSSTDPEVWKCPYCGMELDRDQLEEMSEYDSY